MKQNSPFAKVLDFLNRSAHKFKSAAKTVNEAYHSPNATEVYISTSCLPAVSIFVVKRQQRHDSETQVESTFSQRANSR